MDANENLIQIEKNDYINLLSAQLVLNVISNSIKKLNEESSNAKEKQADATENCSNTVKVKKHFNTSRWNCVSRPQYKYSCGISSLVSCWNYLYSTLGHGKLNPIGQEDAMNILGFSEPYDEIRFGPFTGNKTLITWFNSLNKYFSVHGKGSFFYKPVGFNKTVGLSSTNAKEALIDQLSSKSSAFIYHCYNHYCCPIGYEREPLDRTKIFNQSQQDFNSTDWIILAETSKKYPSLHAVKWHDIERDLNTKSPEYLNIRHLDRGVQVHQNLIHSETKKENNLHCILKFESLNESNDFSFMEFSFKQSDLFDDSINDLGD